MMNFCPTKMNFKTQKMATNMSVRGCYVWLTIWIHNCLLPICFKYEKGSSEYDLAARLLTNAFSCHFLFSIALWTSLRCLLMHTPLLLRSAFELENAIGSISN